MAPELYFGIMSGTSLDGIDIAVCRFDEKKIEFLGLYSEEWKADIRKQLFEFATVDRIEMNALVRMHFELATIYADALEAAMDKLHVPKKNIRAIGLHGQTIRHLPNQRNPETVGATFQLGSGAALAAIAGIEVVSDFRSADMAVGGQGAPLVPSFDYYFLASDTIDRLILNIGGIANVTWLPKAAAPEAVIAFDCGPGNMLIDSIAQHYFRRPFDDNGTLARTGKINEDLLQHFLAHPFFSMSPPKSTGRELFSESFLAPVMKEIESGVLRPEDALAALTELTARTIAQSLDFLQSTSDIEIIVSGGGAFNKFLLERIEANARRIQKNGNLRVSLSDTHGIAAKAKEAIAFAFFAKAFIERIPIHLPRTTGATRRVTLGTLNRGISP